MDEIEAAYPDRTAHDGTVASRGHDANNPKSDHRPKPTIGKGIVRAVDAGEKVENDGIVLADAIRATRDERVKYVLHENRIFSSYPRPGRAAWEWATLSIGHPSHVHTSLTAKADADGSPWNLGLGTTGVDMPSLPLKLGDGEDGPREAWKQEVKRVQYGLRALNYDVGTVDGEYGPKLVAAVVAFRADQGTTVDGETWSGFSDQYMIQKLGSGGVSGADVDAKIETHASDSDAHHE